MIDLSKTGQVCRKYSDSVLRRMSKDELIELVHMLEDNYDALMACNINQANVMDEMLKENNAKMLARWDKHYEREQEVDKTKQYQHEYYERVIKPKRKGARA